MKFWSVSAPDAVIGALFSEAGPDGGALLLDDGSFVGYRLARPDIANELLD